MDDRITADTLRQLRRFVWIAQRIPALCLLLLALTTFLRAHPVTGSMAWLESAYGVTSTSLGWWALVSSIGLLVWRPRPPLSLNVIIVFTLLNTPLLFHIIMSSWYILFINPHINAQPLAYYLTVLVIMSVLFWSAIVGNEILLRGVHGNR